MQFRQFVLGIILTRMVVVSARAEVTTNPPLCVMTYNLRYASATGPNAWPQRRPIMRELLTNAAPDLIGTQEGLHAQLQDLASDLPDYAWTGVGRDDGKTKGEFMAVFYRRARLEALATNHFWLSDTPQIPGSKTWGNHFPRMVTWLKFRDRLNGGAFFLFNTHLDHEVQRAREESARLIQRHIAALETNLPILLIGDFNAAAGINATYALLTTNDFFHDAWLAASARQGEGVGTFNDFQPGLPQNSERIDWILTHGNVSVDRAQIMTFSRSGQYPSDHFPFVTWLKLQVLRRE